jgi:hypothetical protein
VFVFFGCCRETCFPSFSMCPALQWRKEAGAGRSCLGKAENPGLGMSFPKHTPYKVNAGCYFPLTPSPNPPPKKKLYKAAPHPWLITKWPQFLRLSFIHSCMYLSCESL